MKDLKSPISYTLSAAQYKTLRETLVQVRSLRKPMVVLLQTEVARCVATFLLHLPAPIVAISGWIHTSIMMMWAVTVLGIIGYVTRKTKDIDFTGSMIVLDSIGRPSLPPSTDTIPDGIPVLRLDEIMQYEMNPSPSSRRQKVKTPIETRTLRPS